MPEERGTISDVIKGLWSNKVYSPWPASFPTNHPDRIYVLEILHDGYDLSNFLCSDVDINVTRNHTKNLIRKQYTTMGLVFRGTHKEPVSAWGRKPIVAYYAKGKNQNPTPFWSWTQVHESTSSNDKWDNNEASPEQIEDKGLSGIQNLKEWDSSTDVIINWSGRSLDRYGVPFTDDETLQCLWTHMPRA